MLLLSNYKRCEDVLAKHLSDIFVALDTSGKPVSALKSFDTDTGVAKTLDDADYTPAAWELRAHPLQKVEVSKRVDSYKKRIEEAGHAFAYRVVAVDYLRKSFCSFCPPREVRHAFRDLWDGERQYSLIRSSTEQEIMIQLYKAEKALDRIDAPLLPYLDRLNAPHSVISTYLSCDGDRRGAVSGGYVDFRTSLTQEDVLRLFIGLRRSQAQSVAYPGDLGLRPKIFSADRFYTCYTLRAQRLGWRNFEPILAELCRCLNL